MTCNKCGKQTENDNLCNDCLNVENADNISLSKNMEINQDNNQKTDNLSTNLTLDPELINNLSNKNNTKKIKWWALIGAIVTIPLFLIISIDAVNAGAGEVAAFIYLPIALDIFIVFSVIFIISIIKSIKSSNKKNETTDKKLPTNNKTKTLKTKKDIFKLSILYVIAGYAIYVFVPIIRYIIYVPFLCVLNFIIPYEVFAYLDKIIIYILPIIIVYLFFTRPQLKKLKNQ